MRLKRMSRLLLGLAVLAGCGGGDATGVQGSGEGEAGGPDADGDFSASVTGAATYEESGPAFWYDEGGDIHIVLDNPGWAGLNFAGAAPLSPGARTLTGDLNATNQATVFDGARFWLSESGSVTIDSADADRITGTFDFIATHDPGDGVQRITVTGEFEAVCIVSETDTSRC